MNSQSQVRTAPLTHVIPFHERRHDARRPAQCKATLHVLDGEGAGEVHEIQTRNVSEGGMCFLLRRPLAVGQTCRIETTGALGRPMAHVCEVVRSRLLSNGKHEMAVQYRRAA